MNLPSLDDYSNAIGSVESSGRYDRTGPWTTYRDGTQDRPYGKHQVMGKNVGPWTQQALGYSMTPEQFLGDKDAQETVFKHIYGGYLTKYGNPDDATSAWFSGRPLAQAANSRDVLGTTGSGYVTKVNAALGRGGDDASPMTTAFAGERKPMDATTPMQAAMAQGQGNYDPNAPMLDRLKAGGPGALFGAPGGIFPGANGQPGYNVGRALAIGGAALRDNPTAMYSAAAASNDRKFVQIGTDEFGNPRYGFVDPKRGSVTAANANAVDQNGSSDTSSISKALASGKTGEELLKDVPPSVAAQVRAMADGTMGVSASALQRTPQGRMLGSILSQYSGVPVVQHEAYQAAAKDWATKSAETTRRATQMAYHLGRLPDSFDALQNTSSPLYNEVGNLVNEHVMGSGKPNAFRMNVHALADEASAFLKGSNSSDAEIKSWEQKYKDSASPTQFKDALREFRGLMGDSFQGLADKRRAAVGERLDAKMPAVMNPAVKSSFDKIDAYLNDNKQQPGANPKGVKSIQLVQ
jgi:hypothetical protein